MLGFMLALNFLAPINAQPADQRDIKLLEQTVNRVARSYPARTAQLGVVIEEAASGRRLILRQADREFAPASNFKLLDAAAALSYLGANFRFTTSLLARGSVSEGVLNGDLILVGGGDPVLTRDDLRAASVMVKEAGIAKIAGTVLVDGSLFDGQRYGSGWAWDDMPYYYQPPIEALAVDEGTVGVNVTPGDRVGAPVTASLERDPGSMSVVSIALTSQNEKTDDVDCFRSPGSKTITIVGHVPLGKRTTSFRCAVEDTNDDAAAAFMQMLADAGITVGAAPVGERPMNIGLDMSDSGPLPPALPVRYPGASVLWEHNSPTLTEILRRMLPPSDNFIADHLFKMLPVAALGQRGSFDGGASVERQFLRSLGLDPRSLDNGDGSGLSQGDRITPLDLAEILRWETRSGSGAALVNALARAGINGTVRHHLKGSDAIGRVLAKDGYIWHVSTFSGYALSKHHGLIVFSIMFNDVNGLMRPIYSDEDEIVKAIVNMP
jgi:D-alanyl-D-alanine carboxypeptidase/D-alanyl-D-alanine-endopeptidase (penicillin-binding protein 4)